MHKKITAFYSLIFLLAFLPGCFWNNAPAQKTGLVIVDVNSQKQYDDCHIKGAIHTNFDQLDALAQTLDTEKADVIFYCSNYMCAASGAAAQKFMKLGFKSVAAYEGGIAEWHQKGLPTQGPAQEPYLKIVMKKPMHENQAFSMIEAEALAEKMGISSTEETLKEEAAA